MKRAIWAWVLIFSACGSSEDDGGRAPSGDAGHDSAAVDASVFDAADAETIDAADASADASSDASPDANVVDAGDAGLPDTYTLTASAQGSSTDGSEQVQCTMTIYFSNVVHDAAGGWHADMGGEVYRTIFAGSQKYEFQSLIGFDADLVVSPSGVELILNDMPDPNEKPFWQAIATLTGDATGAQTWAGDWTCAPLMIDQPGFVDMTTSVQGTWSLAPP